MLVKRKRLLEYSGIYAIVCAFPIQYFTNVLLFVYFISSIFVQSCCGYLKDVVVKRHILVLLN